MKWLTLKVIQLTAWMEAKTEQLERNAAQIRVRSQKKCEEIRSKGYLFP